MTVVFKLGGSLLTLPGLAEKLRTVFDQFSDKNRLIVIGGGASADVVREWSRIHRLSDNTAHWLAIASTDLNRQLLETLLSFRSVSDRDEAIRLWSKDSSPLLLDCHRFVRDECDQRLDSRLDGAPLACRRTCLAQVRPDASQHDRSSRERSRPGRPLLSPYR